jgi:HPt (histidine-containing phosphotransfer) domain-containing protein
MPVTPSDDLDLTFLYEIADGSTAFVIESIDMLLQQAPELIGTIKSALQANDWLVAAGAAHKLKPSMGFFGMSLSQELLQEIEQLCKGGGQDPQLISGKLSQAEGLISQNMVVLEQIKAQKEAEL